MSYILNQSSNAAGSLNTGAQGQSFDMKKVAAIIMVPVGTVIPQNAAASAVISTVLQSILTNASPLNRGYFIGGLVNATDNTGDPTMQNFDDGSMSLVQESKPTLIFTHIGGAGFHKKLRRFNDRENDFDVLLIDQDARLVGVNGTDGAGTPTLASIDLSNIYANQSKISDGKTVTDYKLTITLDDEKAFSDNYAFYELGSIAALKKMVVNDVMLAIGSAPLTSGTAKVKATYGEAKDFFAKYTTEAAVNAAWKATNAAGLPIGITGVTIVQTSTGYEATVVLNTTTNYPTSGGTVLLSLVNVEALGALTNPIRWFESNVLSLTV